MGRGRQAWRCEGLMEEEEERSTKTRLFSHKRVTRRKSVQVTRCFHINVRQGREVERSTESTCVGMRSGPNIEWVSDQ